MHEQEICTMGVFYGTGKMKQLVKICIKVNEGVPDW